MKMVSTKQKMHVLFFAIFLLGSTMMSMGNAQSITTRNEVRKKAAGRNKMVTDSIETKYLRNNGTNKKRRMLTQLQRKETIGTKNDDDKVCVIHVGPHKTGSSSLQDFILANDESQVALEKDNYKVPFFSFGTHFTNDISRYQNHALLAWCIRVNDYGIEYSRFCPTESFRRDILTYLQSFVNDAAENGANILLTTEELARYDVDIIELMNYFIPQYKIHIVMYYRRFYDWIHSLYNQLMKNGKDEKKVTFVEWLTNVTLQYYHQVYATSVYNRYEKAPGVFNISVVNMHEDPDNFDTNVRFACEHLDRAPHLCELSKSDDVSQSNVSKDLDWPIFRSRIRLYHSIRLQVRDIRWGLIEEKFRQMTDIPLSCLSSDLKDKILEISLESEIALTTEQWHNSKEGLENLKSNFKEKSNSKLCSIDIRAILTSTTWQNFLTDLEENQIKEGS